MRALGIHHVSFLIDPSGNAVELYQRTGL